MTEQGLSPYGLPKYELAPSISQYPTINDNLNDFDIISQSYLTNIKDESDNYEYVIVVEDIEMKQEHIKYSNINELNTNNNNNKYGDEVLRRLYKSGITIKPEKHRIGNLHLIKLRGDDKLLEEWAEKMQLLIKLKNGCFTKFEVSLKSHFVEHKSFPYSTPFRSFERQLILKDILSRELWEGGAELDDKLRLGIKHSFPLHVDVERKKLYFEWKNGFGDKIINSNSNSFCKIFNKHFCIKNDNKDNNKNIYNSKNIENRRNSLLNFLIPRQPLSNIVEYFGEEVGFYFAFVEYLIKWLYMPTIFGIVVFIFQIINRKNIDINNSNNTSNTSNNNNNNNIGDISLYLNIDDNNILLPWYSFFICIWTSCFIQFWKRKQNILSHYWGVLNLSHKNLSHNDEITRSGFKSECDKYNIRVYPVYKRRIKLLISTPIVILMVCSCFGFMLYFLELRKELTKRKNYFGVVFHTLLWGFIVPILSSVHTKICGYLTDWENWRTESEHTKYYTAKVCSLKLFNTFIAMYYIAIVERSLVSVGFQVASFMISGLLGNIFSHTILQRLVRDYKTRKIIKDELGPQELDPSSTLTQDNKQFIQTIDLTGDGVTIKRSSEWQQAFSLSYDSFKQYMILTLLFGYVSCFSVAFSLAPLIALIGLLFKLKSDRYSLCFNLQRPLPRRVSGIGIWLQIIEKINTLAIITNVIMMLWTSNQSSNYFPNESEPITILIGIAFEHLLIFIRYLLTIIIPEVPLQIREEITIQNQKTQIFRRKVYFKNSN